MAKEFEKKEAKQKPKKLLGASYQVLKQAKN